MKVPFVVAIIAKDAVEQLPVVVPAHEVAVLSKIHGETKVSIDETADLPNGLDEFEFDPDEEYDRLENKYGLHSETKMPYAALTYGGRQAFVDGIEGYVNGVIGDADAPAPRKTARKNRPAANNGA